MVVDLVHVVIYLNDAMGSESVLVDGYLVVVDGILLVPNSMVVKSLRCVHHLIEIVVLLVVPHF